MISVIIPVYNAQSSIKRCIESILHQDFKDYEVILVDDGSTDNSLAICNEYALTNSNVFVIHHANSGPAYSRKKGIEAARGDFLLFADSDDYYLDGALSILFNNLTDCDIVCAQPSPLISKVYDKYILSNNEVIDAYFNHRILHGSYWAALFKKDLFCDVDFCDKASIGEDVNTILQVYLKAHKIHVIPTEVYAYKRNDTSISNNGYTVRHKEGFLKYVEYKNKYCVAFPNYEKEISAFYTEYEMAVFTAMCRNNTFDIDVINMLKSEIRNNFKFLLTNKSTAYFYKASAILLLINHNIFAMMFKIIRKYVGR